MLKNLVLIILLSVYCLSCKDDSVGSDNPYDTWKTDGRGTVIPDLPIDPNSIQGLHKNIFKPTCANSGCHDGNFEPDFRSIESTYNSLINRHVTNPDPNNANFAKRVVPRDAANSMLLHRINTFIPGSQGVMPLTYDPGSDWPDKKLQYIQNITNWINNGCKDQFGKTADSLDFAPQAVGMIVFADGSGTPLSRSGKSPVEVSAGSNTLKIMVAFMDDKTAPNQFGTTTLNYSTNPYDFTNPEIPMTVNATATNANSMLGNKVDYWHSATINLSSAGIKSGDVIWIRVKTSDKVNPPLFMPAETASFNIIQYYAFRVL
jgi:hypothetical protein